MPLLSILSNQQPTEGVGPMLSALSRDLAVWLGKPEEFVMLSFQHSPNLLLGGSDAPLAYLELKSIGLPKEQTEGLSKNLCLSISNLLGVRQDRIYIEFADALPEMWGWNGGTFA